MRSMRIRGGVRSLYGVAIAGALIAAAVPAVSNAQVSISVSFGPPALPVYEQPPMPEDGYVWTPGYWSYADDVGYYWVPGTWVPAPQPGYLWTPGYWGWSNGVYVWNAGYWGEHVGYYGGVNYGYGYGGEGYQGGYWNHGHMYYNRSVNNISTTTNVTNVYNKTVIVNNTTNVSYNGGPGGVNRRPTAQEQTFSHEQHVAPTPVQTRNRDAAKGDRTQWASQNQGKPAVAATPKPGEFRGNGVVMASRAGGTYHPPANTPANTPQSKPGITPQPKPAGSPRPAVHPTGANPNAARPAGDHPNIVQQNPHPNSNDLTPKNPRPEGEPQGQEQGRPQARPPEPQEKPQVKTQAGPQGTAHPANPQPANHANDHPQPQGPKPEEKPREAPKPPPPQDHHDQPGARG